MDVDRLLDDLARWAGERRAEEAAASRRGEAELRRQAAEDARLAGTALDLAERGEAVMVRTTTGRQHRGRIVAVADDFLVLEGAGGAPVLLPYAAVAMVRPGPGADAPEAGSPRSAPVGARLVHALAGLAADRPRVTVVVPGHETLGGELRSVGRDVVTLRLEGGGSVVYLPVAALTEVTVHDWGP